MDYGTRQPQQSSAEARWLRFAAWPIPPASGGRCDSWAFSRCITGRLAIIIIIPARKWSAWRPRQKCTDRIYLLTTEKDAMNLPESAAAVLKHSGVQLHWLKIGVKIENEEQLLELIASKMRLYDPPPFTRRDSRRYGV